MSNLKHFRARTQKSGVVYYYFDAGGKPRKEIPLGKDYVLAVKKWTEIAQKSDGAPSVTNFEELAKKYERDEIPTKEPATQATQRSDMKHLRKFFCEPNAAPLDDITPVHIRRLLDKNSKIKTTANRLKRLFSHMFNKAREWGYTKNANPAAGIKGYDLGKRMVYVSDNIFMLVRAAGSRTLQDAMDLAYLTGQRPGDVMSFTDGQISDGHFVIPSQKKTGKPLRIRVEGEFKTLLDSIEERKKGYKLWCPNLTVNEHGKPVNKKLLRRHFVKARAAAATQNPKLAKEILAFWFYDLRAKAADDTADEHGDQAAADLLGHDNVSTTKRHYLRRGKRVSPTK